VLEVEGDVHLRAGDIAAAETCYRQALSMTPDSEPALLRLGAALASGDQKSEFAALIVRIAALHKPDAAMAAQDWWDLGRKLAAEGAFTPAVTALTQCIALTGVGSRCARLLGEVFLELGWTEDARRVLSDYRSANPDDPRVEELLKQAGG
jgi:predicted Zn-dependent protease